ncbi:MAG: hypothetical protein ACLVHS_03070 [Blautia wexlerae]
MDYKKQIIEMLEKIDNIYWLKVNLCIHENADRIVVRRYSMDYKRNWKSLE